MIVKLFRLAAAAGGFALAGVVLYAGIGLSHRESQAASAPMQSGAARLAPNELRYPPGSSQLAFLAIRAAEAVPLPALEPLPARLAYDENHTARIYSPLAGRTVSILAQPGDHVAAQQVLAWIDSPDYGTALADQRKAQADDTAKQAALARAQRLFDAGVIAARDLEGAQADAQTSKAELDRAAARLHGLGAPNAQGRYAVRAPIAGVIAERHLNPGQEVRPDAPDPLFVITDPTQLDVVADVAESDVTRLRVGQAVRLDAESERGQGSEAADGHDAAASAPGHDAFTAVPAKITSIGVGLDPNTRRVPVRAKLVSPPAGARPERFVRFTAIDERSPATVVVPNGAIVTSGLQSFVFVETEPGLLVKRAVRFALRGRDASYVQSGLKSGERVVTQGALLVDADLSGGD